MRLPHPNDPARRSGIALVVVLASLVILVTLTVAFLSSSVTELRSSKSFADGGRAQVLAQSAANLAMAQITAGTKGVDDSGKVLAWASQPGMIRTYDTSGNPAAAYKLYSWDVMTTDGPFDPEALESAIPENWNEQTALFTDLNEPIRTGASTLYPIIDANDLAAIGGAKTYDANSDGNPDIEGFSISASAPVDADNPVPMPVKWLYVLADGTIVAPRAGETPEQVVVEEADYGEKEIVGRIAFWADDDTTKINVNTASEGNFWDTPRAQGISDFNFASFQPVQKEYQRYPGHPATTSLSAVFGSLYPVDHSLRARNTMTNVNYNPTVPATYEPYIPYYEMAPKLNMNTPGFLGSEAGTKSVTQNKGKAALNLKGDRLYASIDELLFKSNLINDETHTTAFAGERPRNISDRDGGNIGSHPVLDSDILEKAKFFITPHSRAPDVNLFNKPRIVTWPVHVRNEPSYRTPFDQALAFCGTINDYIFYFQRERNDHPTNDLPATGGPNGLSRNRMLLDYLRALTSQPIPGFGGTFASKFTPEERDQILTQIFDYIRALNLNDKSFATMTHPFAPRALTSEGYHTKYANTSGYNTFSPFASDAGAGQVVPIQDVVTDTRGFGRFPTISEVSLIFIATGWNDGKGGLITDVNRRWEPEWITKELNGGPWLDEHGFTAKFEDGTKAPWGYFNSGTNGQPGTVPPGDIPPGHIQIQAALLINFFDPSQGTVRAYYTNRVSVEGLEHFRWGEDSTSAVEMGFPTGSAAVSSMIQLGESSKPQQVTAWGGNRGFRAFATRQGPGKTPGSYDYYPYFSDQKVFPYDPESATPGSFYFSGGELTFKILLPTNTPGWSDPVQEITLSFPSAVLPLPTYPAPAQNNDVNKPKKPFQTRGSFGSRFQLATNKWGPNSTFIVAEDTVRSVRAYPGDIRIIAGRNTVRDTEDDPAPEPGFFDSTGKKIRDSGFSNWDYFDSTKHLVHSLRESCDYPFMGALLGQLVPGIRYAGLSAIGAPFTDYSSGLNTFSGAGNNATTAGAFIGGGTDGLPGDWDNGFGYTADGPFINKADEGNINDSGGRVPYFGNTTFISDVNETFFSPNRLMPSPVMFGSLPAGVKRNIPWQTLLFCPNPAAGDLHPGFGAGSAGTGPSARPPFQTPPDHLLLDLFNMPVVEPYPISEPLSTAGRINMNYQIVPFTYIKRSTGLRAVLKAEHLTVIPDSAAQKYKHGGGTEFKVEKEYDFRSPVDVDETIKGFDAYFEDTKDIFRSASQICTMFLYPERPAHSSGSVPKWTAGDEEIKEFWNGPATGTGYKVDATSSSPTHYLTGDNSRERPYASIYPRLTTKSNTFTIHFRAQALKKARNGDPQVWGERGDQVSGEFRGFQTVERYVDPNRPVDREGNPLPDYADPNVSKPISDFYKFRIVQAKQFAP
jgi:uncharacterized protein (TIGR02600 family)